MLADQGEAYVDINTEPTWTSNAVSMIDLDFDVLRHRDGTVELLDEDEFDDHRVRYGYPPDLVEFARSAAASTMALANGPADPFARAWRDWYARIHNV